MSGLQLLSQKPKNALVAVEMNNEKVNVTIYAIDGDIKHRYSEDGLIFDIKLHANGKYTDSQLDGKNASYSEIIERLCCEKLKERIKI